MQKDAIDGQGGRGKWLETSNKHINYLNNLGQAVKKKKGARKYSEPTS
jgi:hypothetical protein